MDELAEFCARVLGDRPAAEHAAQRARREGDDRLKGLARAVVACREADGDADDRTRQAPDGGVEARREPDAPDADADLATAVARELALASGRLPLGQREALALDRIGCSHGELATVVGIEPAGVAPLLARARLRLRYEIRGGQAGSIACPERDRALRTIALRQDGEPVPEADDDWLLEHLGHCEGCAQVHAAMLEASVCYRAWRLEPAP
jgi:hypothetical protein